MSNPQPLFDTLENFSETNHATKNYIQSLTVPLAEKEFNLCSEFLKSYANSADTFTAYRREVERLLHWSWLIAKKPLKELNRNDIRDYLHFVNEPPKPWITTKTVSRFIA
ncbi:hypothetical protein AYO45_06160 [Gammaproteobacteria bacterium SCGC AG-212-F23]|nr:hypothetical protein AYO45_06160 [Gammaproteobacteria bacterium SCGC AG-212-F23]